MNVQSIRRKKHRDRETQADCLKTGIVTGFSFVTRKTQGAPKCRKPHPRCTRTAMSAHCVAACDRRASHGTQACLAQANFCLNRKLHVFLLLALSNRARCFVLLAPVEVFLTPVGRAAFPRTTKARQNPSWPHPKDATKPAGRLDMGVAQN